MDGLVLTLGHGSSAILIRDGKIINGYMNERITKIKSDSQFPMQAIEAMREYDVIEDGIDIYISHWNPSGNVYAMSERHFNHDYIDRKFSKSKIISLNKDFTHHKAHAYSVLAYTNDMPENSYIIVADGFGNFGEVFSIYTMPDGEPVCLFSSHNYMSSLGLLYQYATDYVGLKMNQDEWKLNAAAANVDPSRISSLDTLAYDITDIYINRLKTLQLNAGDPMLELGALSATHKNVIDLIKSIPRDDKSSLAYVLQSVVENVVTNFIDEYNIENVMLVGGVFMNVQLNKTILNHIKGKICVMPLSGDNGAGLGLFKYHNPEFMLPNHFCWGKRNLHSDNIPKSMEYVYTHNMANRIRYYLHKNKIVNVVRGNMEFGERAYCNTSTIARPTKDNSRYINNLNGRDNLMPMAPVMTKYDCEALLLNSDKVVKSLNHMIMSLEYVTHDSSLDGVSHKMPNGVYTCRPQLIDKNHYLYKVCVEYGMLINTSFNMHGKPICKDIDDVITTHTYQLSNDTHNRVITLVEKVNERI